GALDEAGARRARIVARIGDPHRLARLPDRADQSRAPGEAQLARAFDEALRAFDRRVEPLRIAAQLARALVRLPDLGAVPAFGLAQRLQRAAERLLRRRVLGEAPGDAVLEPQQPLDALLRGDVAADAAIAGEAAFRVEQRLAGGEHVAAAAVLELAPHQHVAERRARLESRAMLVPAAFDLDAGFPALLADDRFGERLLYRIAATDLDAREAQLRVLLPVPVGRQAGNDAARRAFDELPSRAPGRACKPLRHGLPYVPGRQCTAAPDRAVRKDVRSS